LGFSARAAAFAAVALVVLGLAGGLYSTRRRAGPATGEATALGMVASLWNDGDLRFDSRDLDRAFQVWEEGPRGVRLAARRPPVYAAPVAYALAALPAYAAAGPRGVLLFNAGLYLLLFGLGWVLVREGGGWAGVAVAGFFFASAALTAAFRFDGEAFAMACAFLPLALWRLAGGGEGRRGRLLAVWGLAGALAVAGALAQPLLALLAVPVVVDLAWGRRLRRLGAFAAGALLAAALLLAAGRRLTGSWLPQRAASQASFESAFPVGEEAAAAWQAAAGSGAREGWLPGGPPARHGLQALGWFLCGRHAGLLPYYPFALLVLAFTASGRGGRRQRLLLAAVALYGLAVFLTSPAVAAGALGDRRLAAACPALWLLLGERRPRRSLLLAYAAAALWTVPAVALAVAAPAGGEPAQRLAAFTLLPQELDLVAAGAVPGYAARRWGEAWWIVPESTFFVGEEHPHGVWVRGASDSEVVLAAPAPLPEVRFRVHSLAGADNRLRVSAGAERVSVVFDSLAKRQGTEAVLHPEPAARGPAGGTTTSGAPEVAGGLYFYRLRLRVSGGEVAAHHYPGSGDRRYLGVFLDFTGGGP
jgi:hypothetical protein